MLGHAQIHPASKRVYRYGLGMTLVEVLVALAVVSVAMVGAMAYQNQALKSAVVTSQRANAQILCHDLFERIRSNKAGTRFYAGASLDPALTMDAIDMEDGSGFATNFAAHPQGATPAAVLANNDLRDWTQSLADQALEVNAVDVTVMNPENEVLEIVGIEVRLGWNRQLSAREFEWVNGQAAVPEGYVEGETFRREEFVCETRVLREIEQP